MKYEYVSIDEPSIINEVIKGLEQKGFKGYMGDGNKDIDWVEGYREFGGVEEVVIEVRMKVMELK